MTKYSLEPIKKNKKIIIIFLIIFILSISISIIVGKKYLSISEEQKALNNYKKSIPKLEKELAKDPNSIKINNDLAYALYIVQDNNAINAYKKATQLDNNNDKSFNNLGNLYRKNKQYEEAIEAYEKAISINPNNVTAYINKAHVYIYELQNTEQGIETLKSAIENNPNNSSLYLLIAKQYRQSGQEEEAKKAYQKVIEIDPNNPIAPDNLNQ